MITTRCICGETIEAPEAYLNQPTLCPVCETKLRFVCAEALADGGGAADFDSRLLIIAGPAGEGEQLFLGGVHEILIGNSSDCHIRLPSSAIASRHCQLVRVDFGPSRWRLVADESAPAVLANKHQIVERELHDGDTIVIGDFEFQYASISQQVVPVAQPAEAAQETIGPTCPSCRRKLPNRAHICVHCGINIVTGKPIVMSKGLDEAVLADEYRSMDPGTQFCFSVRHPADRVRSIRHAQANGGVGHRGDHGLHQPPVFVRDAGRRSQRRRTESDALERQP